MSSEDRDVAIVRSLFMSIDDFVGEFEFLDLKFNCDIVFKGLTFPSVYHTIFFLQFGHDHEGKYFCYNQESEGAALEVGLKVAGMAIEEIEDAIEKGKVNPNWSQNCDGWLECALRDKYKRNTDLRERLSRTGERRITYTSRHSLLKGDTSIKLITKLTQVIREDIQNRIDHINWLRMCCDMCDQTFSLDVVESSSDDEQSYRLRDKSCYTIGRLELCDIRPLNTSISRVHAAVFFNKRGEACLVNFNIASGLELEGTKVPHHKPQRIGHDTSFKMGTSRKVYTVHLEEDLVKKRLSFLHSKQREIHRQKTLKTQSVHKELDRYLHGCKEIVVLNVSYKTKQSELLDLFEPCGQIESIVIPQASHKRSRDGRKIGDRQDEMRSEIRGDGRKIKYEMRDEIRGDRQDGQDGRDEMRGDGRDESVAERGIAFITFKEVKGAEAALEKDGSFLNYRRIRVRYREG